MSSRRLAQAPVTKGGWYYGKGLTDEERRAAEDRWAHRAYTPPGRDEEYQCGGCRFFAATGADFGICANPASPLDGMISFEHGGCASHSEMPARTGRGMRGYEFLRPTANGWKVEPLQEGELFLQFDAARIENTATINPVVRGSGDFPWGMDRPTPAVVGEAGPEEVEILTEDDPVERMARRERELLELDAAGGYVGRAKIDNVQVSISSRRFSEGWLCGEEVDRPANGAGGLAKTAQIQSPCGRRAIAFMRGFRVRADGSIFKTSWRTVCRAHGPEPGWEERWRAEYPNLPAGPWAVSLDKTDE